MTDSKNNKKRRRRKINNLKLAILAAAVIFITLGGIGFGVLAAIIKSAPVLDPKKLETNQTSFIYDENENLITKIHGAENRVPVDINQVPSKVKRAFLAIEDVNFYKHSGISIRGMVRAVLRNVKDQNTTQGASTITQQLVKRTFLSPEKKYKRKIQEAYLAIKLERQYTKDEILEMYLNQIYFGHGAYGIQAAANVYFNKPIEKLTLAEAAMLAGIPKSPVKYDPYRNPKDTRQRQLLVLALMDQHKFITKDEFEAAKSETVELSESTRGSYPYTYFVEYVIEELVDKYGPEKVFTGGLRVYTTLDVKIQAAAEKALANSKNFPTGKKDSNGLFQPQAAAIVLNPHNGYIKAIVGGRGRDESQKRLFNRATQAIRQPGSAFKPIIAFGPALDSGMAPASVYDDSPLEFADGYKPKNYDLNYHGMTTMREALTHSYNIVAIQALKEVGITKAHKFAKSLGISSLDPKNDQGLGIALGGISKGVTPLELAGAYGAFANKGTYVEPTVIIKIKDQNDNVIDKPTPKKTKVMKETTAYLMTDMLMDAVTKGTGTNARLDKWQAAGKTGTTNEGKDIWFAGYTPNLVGVVWMGHDIPQPMPRIYGGTYPAKIWREIMTTAHKGQKVIEFPKPQDLQWATVSSKSGLLPSDLCPQEDLVSDIFAKGTVPTKLCEAHTELEVCPDSGLLLTENCPTKVTGIFLKSGISKADPKNVPSEPCNLHGPGSSNFTTSVNLCTDSSHSDKLYIANMPGSSKEGGCPPELVTQKNLPKEQVPTEYCDHPAHQLGEEPANDHQTPMPPNDGDYTQPRNPISNVQTQGQQSQNPRTFKSEYYRWTPR